MNSLDSSGTLAADCTLACRANNELSDTSSSLPVVIFTPSMVSEPEAMALREQEMEALQESVATQTCDTPPQDVEKHTLDVGPTTEDTKAERGVGKKTPRKGRLLHKSNRQVDDSSASETSDNESSSDSDQSSEDEKLKEKKRLKKIRAAIAQAEVRKRKKQKQKEKLKERMRSKKHKSKKHESTDEDESSVDSSESESDSDSEDARKKSKRVQRSSDSDSDSEDLSAEYSSDLGTEDQSAKRKKARAKAKRSSRKTKKKLDKYSSSSESLSSDDEAVPVPGSPPDVHVVEDDLEAQVATISGLLHRLKAKQACVDAAAVSIPKVEKIVGKKGLEFKRVDQVFDMQIHDWKLVESSRDQKGEFDCVFTVRRRLDWQGKYIETRVDIKSKTLRNTLQEVLKDCKSISLVEDTPQLDPRTLFHYYDEMKTHVKKTLKRQLGKAKRPKERKRLKQQVVQCKLLLSYVDEDFGATRKALKPMVKAGTITYDLVWALFKPNTIAFTPTYNNKDDARCFRVGTAYEAENWLTGVKSWRVDGKYLEYDGKSFGLGEHEVSIPAFKGHKKITSLAVYPLKYHKDAKGIKKQLIERGKKFVALQGMNYRVQKGIAYMKHKNSIVRFIVNGRVMVDPAMFRRMNPNYPLSYLRPDELADNEDEDDDDDEECCCDSSGDEDDEEKEKMRIVMWKDKRGRKHPIRVSQSVVDKEMGTGTEQLLGRDEDATEEQRQVLTEEELIIASPVVLGFAFSEKLWLEFSLSGIEEIKWNEEAFSSLVLPSQIKQNLKGLVSSHRFHAAKTIDDVIQGKGKGLNVVLHGPPGVGKTLTGESIAEYLQCPLYAVSAGELGTNSRALEADLNRIMEITHSWGAILLLDEADVFLEARQPNDLHRNSLVSVFLRLTEYYQGILFLTTNRVETFDEAFQSRIHMGIRYEELTARARREIWQQHVGRVERMKGSQGMKAFTEADFDMLSQRVLNGRQIKNTVKTSQAIAVAEQSAFSMEHVKRVLEAGEAFDDDMRGGKGYRDAMRQYT
ncbi:hypothetical protein COCMIDRAFT_39758 [Bipolaris oryzae ATCC 44560]|uniref:AAA+ ATPase domain-containing protein n=1 Tax=Bipolaris oryzae ATCC 44560 TaxID=930090 RepID=W6YXA4_COCMI|nr:uncharacterized protein COCMIDRAFT_39758 [Bipolaris oryzae ATCC 44560]EUC42158.1 hypothetical protein COCMIDRAFT_39758 [Bipolaris oryzae ATCC 44560]